MLVLILRLLVDFGLLVLIWLIQLIVYPSFLHYQRENLVTWHRKYTPLIGYIVGPLMLVQLVLVIYQISFEITFFTMGSLLMVCAVWGITLITFVPRHRAISRGRVNEKLLLDLVRKNWSRTILWTLLFLCSAIYSAYKF